VSEQRLGLGQRDQRRRQRLAPTRADILDVSPRVCDQPAHGRVPLLDESGR
jgi:hypothetical protein